MKKMDQSELKRTIKFVLFSISAGVIQFGTTELLGLLTPWAYWSD